MTGTVTLKCPKCGRKTSQPTGTVVSCVGVIKSENSVGHPMARMQPATKRSNP